MKIRQGFVSNSSSTSFYFITKNNKKESVIQAIKKYGEYFRLIYDGYSGPYSCTENDVIKAIEDLVPDKYDDSGKMFPLTKLVEDIQKDIDLEEQWSKEHPNKIHSDEYWMSCLDKKQNVEDLIKAGFTHYMCVGFGDNHGDVSGGQLGYTMDYEGRYIHIKKEDFVVFTEQNR